MGPIEAKRYLFHELGVNGSTTVDTYDTAPTHRKFLVAQESVNEETISDGTNVAECRPYSKLVAFKGLLHVTGMASGEAIRWMIIKMPDGETNHTNLSTHFHSSLDNQATREIRETTLSKGMIVGSDKTGQRIPIFIKRSTLKRLGSLRENDAIAIILESNLTGTVAQLHGFGTLYVRMN